MSSSKKKIILQNILAGLSVSFLILSLGAAFGVLSEKGVFIGMFSATVMAVVTGLLSGTKVQASSPTGPMTATLIAIGSETQNITVEGISHTQFINLAVIMAGMLLILAGITRLDKWIRMIPNIVVSGFITGIGLLIGYKEFKILFGLQGTETVGGSFWINFSVVTGTLILAISIQKYLNKTKANWAAFIPPLLIAIIASTLLAHGFNLAEQIELTHAQQPESWTMWIQTLLQDNIPHQINLDILKAALPFAIKITLIAYLDSLLTATLIEQKSGVRANHQKDLYAQGISTSLIGAFGGLPGAQSTVPSMMLLNEGGTQRIASVSTGIFSLLGILFLIDLIQLIPQAVFIGIILKIAYDVADPLPFKKFLYDKSVGFNQVIFISAIALCTAFWSLNIAVIGATAFFILQKQFLENPWINDLKLNTQSEGLGDES